MKLRTPLMDGHTARAEPGKDGTMSAGSEADGRTREQTALPQPPATDRDQPESKKCEKTASDL